MKSYTIRSLVFLSFLLLPSLALAEQFAGIGAITADGAKDSVSFLASDDLQGRGSGAEGGKVAGDWLATQLKTLKIAPGGVDGTYFQPFTVGKNEMRNVIGIIPGREPGQMVVIGAHYDHLGEGHQPGSLDFGKGRGQIHNGADDNASGTAAVLEIAKAFVASGKQPRRSIVFLWFDGEERGLLGSRRFVKNPTIEGQTVLMINLDMVGRLGDKLTVYGSTTGSTLQDWANQANENVGLELNLKDSINSNSDHAPFYRSQVPVFVPFTGLHKDYHRPSDDISDVNFEGIAQISRLSYGMAVLGAEAPESRQFAKARDGTMEAMLEQFSSMFGGGGGDGENPLGDLGEQLQDLLKQFGGEDGQMPDLSELFGGGGGGDGEGPDMGNLQEMLRGMFGGGGGNGRRARLGVTLEQDGVTLRTVVPDSVAAKAQLQPGDKIVAFSGQPVEDLQGLRGFVQAAKGQVTIEVERNGERVTLTAEFPQPEQPRTRERSKKQEEAPKQPAPDGPRWF